MSHAARAAIGGLCALAIAMGIGRFAYTPLLPWMQADRGFGPEAAGFLASVNLAGYLGGALVLATLPRQGARMITLRAALMVSIITGAAMALVDTVPAWALLRFLAGLASAAVLVAATDVVIATARSLGRPAISGWHFAGVGLGTAASGLIVAAVGPALGWKGGWLALAALSLILLPPAWSWLGPVHSEGSAPLQAGPISRYPLAALAIAYFCEGAGYIVTGTFLVAIVKALPDLAWTGEYVWIAMGLAAAPSTVLWSLIGQRFGSVAALVAAHLLQAIGIALPVMSSDAASLLGSAVLLGGSFMGITALTLSMGGTIAGPGRARAIGRLTVAFGLGQALGPSAAGALATRTGSFDAALVAAAIVVAIGAVFLLLGCLQSRAPRYIVKAREACRM